MTQKLYDLHSTPFDFQQGGVLPFATYALLAAWDDSKADAGAIAYTADYRSPWIKVLMSPAPVGDNTTIMPTNSGDGAWVRQMNPAAWNEVTTFYLNGVSGSDDNDGLTALTPIGSLTELSRRTYNPSSPRSAITVLVTGDVTGSDLVMNSDVEFYGVPVETLPDAGIFAVTPLARAVYAPQIVTTDPGTFDWATALADVLLLRYTSNANAVVGYGWVARANAADSAYTRTFDGGSWYDPLVTDTVAGLTIPVISGSILGVGIPYVGFYKCALSCQMRNVAPYIEMCSGAVSLQNCDRVGFQECRFTSADISGCKGVTAATMSSTTLLGIVRVRGSAIEVYDDSGAIGSGGTSVGFHVSNGGFVNITGSVEVYGSTGLCVLNEPGAVVWLTLTSGAGKYIYGSTNTNVIIHTRTNTQTVYTDKAAVTATAGGAPGNQWSFVDGAGGTVANTFASLPATGSTKLATALVGVFPSV